MTSIWMYRTFRVRSQITMGDLPPKHGQTTRVGSIEAFVNIEQIPSWNTNFSMEPTRIVCPCFGGKSPLVIYDLTLKSK